MSNPDLRIRMPESSDGEDFVERDEIAAVQEALRELIARVAQPFVRACLEEALDDITHLTSCGDEPDGHIEEEAA